VQKFLRAPLVAFGAEWRAASAEIVYSILEGFAIGT